MSDAVDAPANAGFIHLRTLARELYLIAGTLGSESPGLYPSPVDTLRAFLRGETLPGHPDQSYAAAVNLSNAQLAAARSVPANFLGQVQPRPQQLFVAAITASSFTHTPPELIQVPSGQPLRMLDATGAPFQFPPELPLLPETELNVLAFNDRNDGPFVPDEAVEVIHVGISHLPRSLPVDRDQNGLDDNWERLFFGRTGIDPFGDADGDGVTNLEEWLRGTNPTRADSSPNAVTLSPGRPTVEVNRLTNGTLRLRVNFPTEFSGQVGFRLQLAEDLSSNFIETAAIAEPHPDGSYRLELALPQNFTAQFFRFRLFLR